MLLSIKKKYSPKAKELIRSFIGFFLASGIAVVIDFSLFQLLERFDLSIFDRNMISSFVAIIFIYFSTTYIFKKSHYSIFKFIVFFSYYLFSIIFFSYFISFFSILFSVSSIFVKVLSLPFSFLMNYTCVSIIENKFSCENKT